MSTVKFVPKKGKPHIKLLSNNKKTWILSVYTDRNQTTIGDLHNVAYNYCVRVNPYYRANKGDAARDLFNYKGDLCK